MIRQLTALETVQQFCHCWFELRDLEATVSFLSETVSFVGSGEGEAACGKEAMTDYIRQDISEIPEPFACDMSVIYEQAPTEGVRNLSAEITLKNSMYTWYLRGFYILVLEQGIWKVFSIHVAEPSRNQTGGEHYPQTLVVEHIAMQRQKLLPIHYFQDMLFIAAMRCFIGSRKW